MLLAGCGPLRDATDRSYLCMSKGDHCHDTMQGEPGKPGEKGDTGSAGKQGSQGIPGPVGPAGSTGTPGAQGKPGSKGDTGDTGSTGTPGTSCSVSQAVNGAVISCTDGSTVVVLNGTNGTDGEDGTDAPPTPYTVTSIIDPCGKQGTYDEVLLRLGNGQLMAHYSSGNQQFLTLIGPGSYISTDNTSCYFTVDNNMNIVNQHN